MSAGIAHLIDDDEAIRDALSWLLRSRGIETRSWGSAEGFLADYGSAMRGCLVLDIRMQAMSGLELFDRLTQLGCTMPVIFLTGHGDVPVAVQAIKKGAFDFVEKPFNDNELADRVIAALAADRDLWLGRDRKHDIETRLASLTVREREVMDRVLGGKLNKVIADELGIAMRTVEVHRSHVFEKMGVRSAVDLARLLAGGEE
ncbi:MAG: response regulator transcription factor [Rhodocyclaceae bacterium]|nr:response regulator transcription factor [Rhodocyclaceae bacterium]